MVLDRQHTTAISLFPPG